jgi:CheY-like chemotaxis protein
MSILIVDDNAVSRRMLEGTLRGWLMKPVLADSGQAGIAAMETQRAAGTLFPLVLLDAQMPEMDGFSLAEAIQRDPGLAATAIVLMLTSAGRWGDGARCRALGVACLRKPIGRAELLEAILTSAGMPSDGPRRVHAIPGASSGELPQTLRILLAEDNIVNQLVAARLLEKHGHTVVIAANGREALAVLDDPAAGAFALILMDVQMPEMDGFEATRIIRAREQSSGARLPIIAMTAHAMKGDEERCLAAGMDGYVSKPIQIEQLFATIERVLSR